MGKGLRAGGREEDMQCLGQDIGNSSQPSARKP